MYLPTYLSIYSFFHSLILSSIRFIYSMLPATSINCIIFISIHCLFKRLSSSTSTLDFDYLTLLNAWFSFVFFHLPIRFFSFPTVHSYFCLFLTVFLSLLSVSALLSVIGTCFSVVSTHFYFYSSHLKVPTTGDL